MKTFLLTGLAITLAITIWAQHKKQNNMNLNKLTPEEEYVMLKKGTEAPFSGEYNNFYKKGIYLCKQCAAELASSGGHSPMSLLRLEGTVYRKMPEMRRGFGTAWKWNAAN